MGSNNEAGSCGASGGSGSAPTPASTTSPVVVTSPPTTSSWSGSSVVDCSREDGLFPDPDNCRGFIKCAQVKTLSFILNCFTESPPGGQISHAVQWRTLL